MMSLPIEKVSVHAAYTMDEESYQFFLKYQHEDIAALSLQLKPNTQQKALFQQIAHRQKIAHKLPSFYKEKQVYYPPQLSLEQCSSEKTASFKSTLFTGNTFIDLTAGMGVDSLYFSKHFQKGIIIEANESLAEITSHNLALLSDRQSLYIAKGIRAADFLDLYTEKADLIYIDPSRRNEHGNKVFRLQDCEPDVISLLPAMFRISNNLLIKTSPLLDISLACKSLKHVKDVYVVSLNNECKELLFVLQNQYEGDFQVHAVMLDTDKKFSFYAADEKKQTSTFSLPLNYLYEPDVSILKAGGFHAIQYQYPVYKLHVHSHLYTSQNLVSDFPGRVFKINAIVKPSKKELAKKWFDNQAKPGIKKAHITIRNFPASVAELRKKWDIAEGGSDYLFVTTLSNGDKAVLICNK